MKLANAKQEVLDLIEKLAEAEGVDPRLDPESPDSDPGKFLLGRRFVRVIAPFSGYFVNISMGWFSGSEERPEISGGPFEIYAFYVRPKKGRNDTGVVLVDFLQLREWVLGFAPLAGNDDRDHHDWRCDLTVHEDGQSVGFRWGDEDQRQAFAPTRICPLNTLRVLSSGRRSGAGVRYRDFGDAPPDDPDELQAFARRVRRGQARFRSALMVAYEERCAISGHGPPGVLQAAHILSHASTGRNDIDNGLLLRADLHELFDDGLLRINPQTLQVEVDLVLVGTPYADLHGRSLRSRRDGAHPAEALRGRWESL